MEPPLYSISLPATEQAVEWPRVLAKQRIEKKKADVAAEIGALESRLGVLQQCLQAYDEDVPIGTATGTEDDGNHIQNERQKSAKADVLQALGSLGLHDEESIAATYVHSIDRDMAGGYDQNYTILIARQSDNYLVSRQVAYTNNYGIERTLRPHGRKFLLGDQFDKPLQLDSDGMFRQLGNFTLTASRPTKWTHIKDEVGNATETIHTHQLLERSLSLLHDCKITPLIYRNGNPSPYESKAEAIATLGGSFSIHLIAYYDHRPNGVGGIAMQLREISIILKQQTEVKDRYVLHAPTLEVRPDAYSDYDHGNKHLHDKARLLLEEFESAVAKKSSDR